MQQEIFLTTENRPLSEDEIATYWAEGCLSGINVLSVAQATTAREKLAALEDKEIRNDAHRWSDHSYQPWQQRGSAWWHWFMGMCTHPTVVGAVSQILGPDLLIRNADIFVKLPENSRAIRWHTDTTAPMKDADQMLTAWIALSDSVPVNGCMEWVLGSHLMPLPPEVMDKHTLALSEASGAELDALPQRANILKPGQMSLHHFRTIHRSGGNETSRPRIGLVIRFMAATTSIQAAETGTGVLVCGENKPGHFGLTQSLKVTWERDTQHQLRALA